jgi:hypothetical protein
MNASGWVFLLVSVCSVTALTVFCFYKVLNLPPSEEEDLHGPLDIDTGDREE